MLKYAPPMMLLPAFLLVNVLPFLYVLPEAIKTHFGNKDEARSTKHDVKHTLWECESEKRCKRSHRKICENMSDAVTVHMIVGAEIVIYMVRKCLWIWKSSHHLL